MAGKRGKDGPSGVANNPAAPAAERLAASTELQKAFTPRSIGDLLPQEPILRMIKHIQNDLMEQEQLAKAGGAKIIPFPGGYQGGRGKGRGMQSIFLDTLQVNAMGDYYEKPGAMQFDMHRAMVEQTPLLNAIIMTRQRQVSRFCQPQSSRDGPGFAIQHIERGHKLSKEEEQGAKNLTQFIMNCGWEFNPRRRRALKRDSFQQFMMKHVRDSLTMDSAPIETEFKYDRRRGMDGFYAVDGSTIRLCNEVGYEGDDSIYALQVVQGRVHTAYTLDDLIYEVRNPRADVRIAGYGLSETELLIRVITGFLNAMTLNLKGFTDNAIPQGMLNLVGDYSSEDLTAFKNYWNGMVRGVNNRWALPVMASSTPDAKAEFVKFGADFNEMYFGKWMTFLASLACAVYGMGPDEINFESFSVGRAPLSGSDTEEKLASSKDKGLLPLLAHMESEVSDFIVSDFTDKFCLKFTGLEPDDSQTKHEMRKLLLTVDEFRNEEGMDPYPEGKLIGKAPINPALMALYQQEQQAEAGQVPGSEPDGSEGGQDFGKDPDDDQGGDKAPGGEEEAKIAKSIPASHRIGWDL